MVLTPTSSFLSCPGQRTPTPGQPRLACPLSHMLGSQKVASKHPGHGARVGALGRSVECLNRSKQPILQQEA